MYICIYMFCNNKLGYPCSMERVFQIVKQIETQSSFNKDSGGPEFLSPFSYHRDVWNVC